MAKNSSIYQKRGNLNFKERKMISDINSALESNPALETDLRPASNFDELKELHNKMTSTEVEFEDVERKEPTPTGEVQTEKQAPFIDPLNRDEPNVRDYVLDDKFDPFADFTNASKSNFTEPTNFGQAFDLPDEDEMRGNPQTKNSGNNSRPQQRSQQRPQPIQSGEDTGKDKRRSKRFAKSVVNTVCDLLEVGFVWYATKDINEQKLAEYELSNEIDVHALLTLPDGNDATVKEFFLSQLGQIEQASKVSQDDREDLIESLTELFIEKNIQPSPAYEFGLNALTVVAKQGIQLYMIVSQNNQIISQLRERNALMREQNVPQNAPEPQTTQFTTPPPPRTPEPYQEMVAPPETEIDEVMSNELSLLDTIETKE
jgi:hypothetical protein